MRFLTALDTLARGDWCRPLEVREGYGVYEPHTCRWLPVEYCLGQCWEGKLLQPHIDGYEFVRGDVPEANKANLDRFIIVGSWNDPDWLIAR